MSNVICQYVPHGAIPDKRGFAPAIVAQNISKYFTNLKPFFISNQEEYTTNYDNLDIGEVYRLKEGKIYTRFFKKITRLDPYPLHIRAAKIINKLECDFFCAHQLELPIDEFKKRINKKLKFLVYVHASGRKFKKERGLPEKYIAVSKFTKKFLIDKFGYPEELMEVVYNGVDTKLFDSSSNEIFRIKNNLNVNDIVISYVGRKQESKGYLKALKIFKVLLEKYKHITIFSVGPTPPNVKNDPHLNEMKKLKEELLNYENFIDLPALPHKKLKEVYTITDILLFPSIHDEQHPLVVLEAMSSKTIVIASKISSMPEVISNNENGFLIENFKDDKNFLNQTIECIDNLNSYSYIKEKARETIISKFDWKISAQKLEEICLSL